MVFGQYLILITLKPSFGSRR